MKQTIITLRNTLQTTLAFSRRVILPFAIACMLLAWYSTAVRAETTGAERLLVLGDSLSAAYGIAEREGWVQLLRNRLATAHPQYEVINASISGETTSGGLRRLAQAIDNWQPAITVIELGGNDGLRGTPVNRVEANLQEMIDALDAADSTVLLLGMRIPPNYGPRYANEFHQMYHQLASRNDVALVSFFLDGVAAVPGMMQADGIHPTAAAQPLLLDNVWPVLAPLLAASDQRAAQ